MAAEKKKVNPLDAWVERDLTFAVRNEEIQPAFQIDTVCEQLTEIIRSGKNPVVSGDSGIGKTAIIHQLVRNHTIESGPDLFGNRRVLQLSIQQRAAGLNKPDEQIRPETQKLITALLGAKDSIVPFFRDFHLAYNFDIEQQLQMLAFQFPSPILGEGERSKIAQMFEDTPELEQNYVILNLEEPPVGTVKIMLHEWGTWQHDTSGCNFTGDALDEALMLTHRFLANDRLPRKAIDLLKQVSALNTSTESIDVPQIIERFCNLHRVPRFLVDPAVKLNVTEEVEGFFHDHILGQDEALKAIIQMIVLIKAGLSDMRRPFGVFLFAGPTGVGKTHVAQCLAEYLFGSRDRLIRLNMADYQASTDALVLFGNPEAYPLLQKKGVLTQRLSGNSFAVMLLDEFEKANSTVHDRFLQLIDEGKFINGMGETIPCRSTIIIATTNEGAEVYRGQTIGFSPMNDLREMDHAVDRSLDRRFRFEFLNRFDRIVHFHPLSRKHIRRIAMREIARLQDRVGMKSRKLNLEIDESVLDWLTVNGFDADYGARFLRRIIERHVTTVLADLIVREHLTKTSSVALSVRKDRIVASVQQKSEKKKTIQGNHKTKTDAKEPADAETLLIRSRDLLKHAAPLLEDLNRKKERISELLETINHEGFWESEKKNTTIEQFRTLDVTTRIEERLSKPLHFLTEVLQECEKIDVSPTRLSRAYDRASEALTQWTERVADDGIGSAWMIISNQDPLNSDTKWLTQIADMECHWCRRLKLSYDIIACSLHDGELSRLVLELEGPGISSYCGMEQGIHRMKRNGRPDIKGKVEIIPRSEALDAETGSLQQIKKQTIIPRFEVCYKTRLDLPNKGLQIDFFGKSRKALSAFAHDARQCWLEHTNGNNDTVRIYGKGGTVEDPRTGVSTANAKDVFKGKLERFYEGWKKMQQENNTRI